MAKKIKCPYCGSTNCVPISEAGVEYRTSLNLNPLHPLTLTKTKKKQKKVKTDEISAGKVATAVMTGGASLLFTGVHKKKKGAHNWYCQYCGTEFTK